MRLKLQNGSKNKSPDDSGANQIKSRANLPKKKMLSEEEKLKRMTPKQQAAYKADLRKKAEALAKKSLKPGKIMETNIAK